MSGCFGRLMLACALLVSASSFVQAQPKLQPRGGNSPPAAQTPGELIESVPANMELVQGVISKVDAFKDAQILTGQNNYKFVRAQYNQINVFVGPEACQEGNCRSLTFWINLGKQQGVDQNWANAWNAQKIWGRAYLDNDGDFVFDMNIHFWGGTTPKYIAESADLFAVNMKALFEFKPNK